MNLLKLFQFFKINFMKKKIAHDESVQNMIDLTAAAAEDESDPFDSFKFANLNAKLVLTTIPQVVGFKKRIEIFQA